MRERKRDTITTRFTVAVYASASASASALVISTASPARNDTDRALTIRKRRDGGAGSLLAQRIAAVLGGCVRRVGEG